MMYEAYEKKVRGYLPTARILKICVKCAIALLIVAAVALLGYLSLRGIYFGEFCLQSEHVAFGDQPKYECFVLFGRCESEYAVPGGEWSAKQPTAPGEYRVRGVITKGLFGKKIYSEEATVVLYRRTVSLTPSTKFGAAVPYGEKPEYGKHWEIASSQLAKGHKVEIAAVSSYEYDGMGGMTLVVDPASVIICDRNGNDVTSGYSLSGGRGTVKVKKRDLTIVVANEMKNGRPVDIVKVYDGLGGSTSHYFRTSGSLLLGDSLSVVATNNQGDAGRYNNTARVKVFSQSGQDRTVYYDLKVDVCKIIIQKRPLRISTPDVTLEYTGIMQHTSDYRVEGGTLAAGQYIKLVHSAKTGVTDVTSRPVDNKVQVQVMWGNRDETKNYDITYDFGSLTVKPRTLYVRTGDSNGLVYNGKAQSWTAYSVVQGSLARGHKLSPSNAATQTKPGSCVNRVDYAVMSSDGKNVTKNYDFKVTYGTLTVEKGAPLRLELEPLFKTYDASPLSPGAYSADTLFNVVGGALLGDDYIEILSTQGSQTEAGESTYSVQYRIMHKEGVGAAVDATDWYAVSLAGEGKLTVAKRTLVIKFDPITTQYHGQAVTAPWPDGTNQLIENYEGKGHAIRFAPNVLDAVVYTKNGQVVSAPVDVGSYTYTIPEEYISVVAKSSGADRTKNYNFRFEGNTIKIEGLGLSLTAPSASKQYDGTPLSADQLSMHDVGIKWDAMAEYRVSYTLTGSQTDAGTCPVGFTNIVITDARGRDVTANFDVKITQGKLTVTPISISVRSSSGNKVYDGKPMDNATQMTLISGNLISGHVLGGSVNADYVTDVGTHKNDKVAPKVYSATGQDVTRNYMITLTPGRYTVKQAPLYIGAPVVQGEYTARPYSGTCDATKYAQGLAQGHKVQLAVESDGIELGMHPMRVTGCGVIDARGRDVTKNYEITYTDGELEIVRRKITVTTGSSTVRYEEAPAVSTNITVGGSGLLEGHEVLGVFTYSEGLYEIGSVSNTLQSVSVRDKNGRDVTEYYDISFVYGTLCVKPIEITLETGSAYKETYDGKVISAPYYDRTKGQMLTGHTLYVTYRYTGGVSDVGAWKNELSSIRVLDKDGNDVSYMYEFTVRAGTLEIANPYPLYLQSFDAEKVYDGMPLQNREYACLTELLDGHRVKGVNAVSLTHAGDAENRLSLIIVDQNGREVTNNYRFMYDEGTLGMLKVTPRDLSITVGRTEPIYNGSCVLNIPQSQLHYEGLVPGQSIVLKVGVETPGVGEKRELVLEAPRIYNASGEDVTDCYNVTVSSEHLSVRVLPASLTLYLPDRYSKEYDGYGVDLEQAGYKPLGLAAGHYVEMDAPETPAHDGAHTLRILEYAVYDQNGEDVTANYEIHTNSCTVTIYKKYIKLTSESASRHYNGQELVCHELKKYTLKGGFTLDVVFTGSQTEVGKSQNTFEVKVYDAEGNDVTAYCNVVKTFGTLEVWDQIKLELISGDALKIFDGEALVCHELSDYELPEGYSLEVVFTGERVEPGQSENTFEVYVFAEDGEDVTDRFAITKKYGTLTVLEKAADFELVLRSESASKTYDGEELTCPKLEPYELPEGFFLEVTFTGSQTEVGQSENTFVARAYNEAGQELTIVYEYGTLEVCLDVTVTAYEKTFTYDGTEKNCEKDDFWTQGLPEGYSVSVTFGAGLTLTGSKDVEMLDVRVYDASGRDVTAMCNLKVRTAKLTVLPRILTVYIYGQSADSIVPVQGTLVDGHTMFAEYGENGECYIEITDVHGELVYSNRGDSPVKSTLYDVIIQR